MPLIWPQRAKRWCLFQFMTKPAGYSVSKSGLFGSFTHKETFDDRDPSIAAPAAWELIAFFQTGFWGI